MDYDNNNNQPQENEVPQTENTETAVPTENSNGQSVPQNNKYVSVSELESSPVYSYTSTDGVPTVVTTQANDERRSDPTVTFDTVPVAVEKTTNSGIKVFFTLLAVTVALIIAASAGFVFGSSQPTGTENKYTGSTQQASKDNNFLVTDKATVFNNVNKSVVCITVYNTSGIQGYASGVVYTDDGYIVTNDHIYSEIASAQFWVTMYDGKEYKAEFIAGDTRSDLAVLKIEVTGLTKAVFGKSDQIAIGEEVIAIGYPSGSTGGSILTSGTISSNSVRISSTSSYSVKMVQTDTPINPGNSGGALVNMYSQVIGIPSVKMAGTEYDNVGYAIPSNTVVKVADSLIKNGYVEGRGRLGISYTEIDSITAELNNVPTGLQVAVISDDSNLAGKGIKIGDIITHINDVKITASSVALDIIENTSPDTAMSFTVYSISDGSSDTVFATLVPDQGNSSYTNKVADKLNNPFENGTSYDKYSDH